MPIEETLTRSRNQAADRLVAGEAQAERIAGAKPLPIAVVASAC